MIPLYVTRGSLAADQLETIYVDTIANGPSDVRNPIRYHSDPVIDLHSPFVDESSEAFYEVEDISLSPAIDAIVEPNPDRDGSISGEPREVQKIIRIRGFVRATSYEQLYDAINALNRAFHPVLTYASDLEAGSVDDLGFVPLKFLTPTEDDPGYILHQYYARSLDTPVSMTTKFDDFNARFIITLLLIDPRKYEQTTQLAERTGPGTVTVDNTDATYPSWPVVKITFSSTVPADDISYRYTVTGAPETESNRAVFLEVTELADAANETLVIDHQFRRAYYEDDDEDKTGAIQTNTRFFEIVPVSHTLTFTNVPADATIDVIWRRAFI